MTEPEFFAYTQLHPTQVSIWYSDGSAPYTVRAISIPIYDSASPQQDVTQYLTQVQQITVPLSTGENMTLNITSRQSVGTSLGNYYYFLVEPYIINNIGNTSIPNDTVVFTPAIDNNIFNDSPYNVLQGSVEADRRSTYIMQSDRYKVGTLANPTYTGPLNIDELLSGSATLAQVQDSNYSSTSWISARYNGTKTSRVDYKAADPAINGRVFEAAEFPSGSSIAQINYQISSSQATYTSHFYAGTGDVPGFSRIYTNLTYTGSYDGYATLVYVQPASYGTSLIPPKAGDLLEINSAEIARIAAVGTISTPTLKYSLQLTRAVYGAAQNISHGSSVYKVLPVQIYNVTGNKLTGVPRGKIAVKETGAILTLDSLGYVVSST